MYLTRKADDFLDQWRRNSGRMPLIVKGPRQVGKTETVRRFARASYPNVVEINFYEQPKFKSIVEGDLDAPSITKAITLIDPSARLVPGQTLIFFDEFQECPQIATALKFFEADGRYDVICSGSLLGTHYKRINSVSVGHKTDYEMLSMDFEEYLWARGYGKEVIEDMLGHMVGLVPFSATEMGVFSELFLDYCVTGGMPAIVRRFIERGNFEGCLQAQRQLHLDYEEDVRKYAEGLDQARILEVYRSVPRQLAKENKKFQYSSVRRGSRARDYEGCVEWLKDAGVVSTCHCLDFPELPIGGNMDPARFKLYYPDTGLLVACLDDEAQDDLRSRRNLGTYKGALYENLVAEALGKQGYPLVYYKREDSTLEEDFFIRSRDALIPVEVKATSGRAKSLSTLIGSERYPDIRCGIKLIGGNVGFESGVYTFPHFCAFLLRRFVEAMGDGLGRQPIA